MTKRHCAWFLALTGLAGALYGLGASSSAMSVALPYIRETTAFSSARLSLLVGACTLGAVVSGVSAGSLADFFGRKRAFLLGALLFALGTPAQALSQGVYPVLLGGVIVQGLGIGILGVVVPLYLAEALPPDMRGKGTGFFQLAAILGIVFSGLLGLALSAGIGPADSAMLSAAAKTRCWRLVFGCEAIPALFALVGAFFLSESPVWLKKSKSEAEVEEGTDDGSTVFQRRYLVPFFIAFTVLVCNQAIGINAVLGYSVTIFQRAGLAGTVANGADAVFKLAMLAATVLACALVDRKGRVFLLRWGTAGVFASMLVAGLVMLGVHLKWFAASALTGWTVAAALVGFVLSFSVGPGVCVWLALTELMPGRIRAVGMSIALVANQGVAMALQATLLPLTDRIGYGWLFLFFAASAVVYHLTVTLFVPETKGRTLEEIEKEWM